MIPCADFIPAYSELFGFLEEKAGKKAVEDLWDYISDNYLIHLKSLVKAHGIRGCFIYWGRALREEAAEFTIVLDEEKGEMRSFMRKCPSMGILLERGHIKPYHDYCGHCRALYARALKPLGYSYDIDISETAGAKCKSVIRKI